MEEASQAYQKSASGQKKELGYSQIVCKISARHTTLDTVRTSKCPPDSGLSTLAKLRLHVFLTAKARRRLDSQGLRQCRTGARDNHLFRFAPLFFCSTKTESIRQSRNTTILA